MCGKEPGCCIHIAFEKGRAPPNGAVTYHLPICPSDDGAGHLLPHLSIAHYRRMGQR